MSTPVSFLIMPVTPRLSSCRPERNMAAAWLAGEAAALHAALRNAARDRHVHTPSLAFASACATTLDASAHLRRHQPLVSATPRDGSGSGSNTDVRGGDGRHDNAAQALSSQGLPPHLTASLTAAAAREEQLAVDALATLLVDRAAAMCDMVLMAARRRWSLVAQRRPGPHLAPVTAALEGGDLRRVPAHISSTASRG